MAWTEGGNDGALNGATPVDVVAAPASSTRRLVKCVVVHNRDSAPVTLTLSLKNGGSTRRLAHPTLAVDDTFVFDEVQCLDSTGKSITAVLSGPPATTNPDFTSTYADAT